jgi:hypothetical protein
MKSKQQKRDEGEKRNAAYTLLTVREKLARLDAGQYAAKRQRQKLNPEGGIQK